MDQETYERRVSNIEEAAIGPDRATTLALLAVADRLDLIASRLESPATGETIAEVIDRRGG